MPKKFKTDNKFVTSKEFNETKKEFIKRFDEIESKMSTKDDIKHLAMSIVQLNDRVDSIEHKMATTMATKDDIRQVLTAIDSFAHKTDSTKSSEKLPDSAARLAQKISQYYR